MPQVDLESLVCGAAGAGAGDRKVSCETVIAGGSGDASPPRWVPPPPPPDHDFPPESITIRIGDDGGGAAFSELNPIYERDDSTKGSTNPKFAAAAASSSNPVPLKARSNSARIAAGPPAGTTTFFGLPVKIRPAFTRRQPSQGRILPDSKQRSGGTGEEPRSPKVSCIGKVLSDRERYGRRRRRRWWRDVAAVFRCGVGGCARRGVGGAGKKMALEDDGYDGEPSVAAMRRFKSGRRADTWAEEALAAVAASGETTTAEEEKKHETEHWVRLPVS
uniref:Uncharacterized protein n=1 Tax=Avena sativa TaxID=4498 RepID=A0ACD5XAR9_AVESA